jgi:hypothetical protein
VPSLVSSQSGARSIAQLPRYARPVSRSATIVIGFGAELAARDVLHARNMLVMTILGVVAIVAVLVWRPRGPRIDAG